jgi:hypothetical protein
LLASARVDNDEEALADAGADVVVTTLDDVDVAALATRPLVRRA